MQTQVLPLTTDFDLILTQYTLVSVGTLTTHTVNARDVPQCHCHDDVGTFIAFRRYFVDADTVVLTRQRTIRQGLWVCSFALNALKA